MTVTVDSVSVSVPVTVRDRPATVATTSRLWGDVQLTNAVFTDAGRVAALLDWEMTGIGAPELDVSDENFGREYNEALVFQVVNAYRAAFA